MLILASVLTLAWVLISQQLYGLIRRLLFSFHNRADGIFLDKDTHTHAHTRAFIPQIGMRSVLN